MGTASRLGAAIIFVLVAQGSAIADPTSQVTNQDIKSALDSCPAGTVEGPDGVCVKPKSGQMGFDLAAPSDNDSSSAPASSSGGTRSLGKVSSEPQKIVDLKITFAQGSSDLNDQDKANTKALATMLMLPKYAHAKVMITGNTDTDGSAADKLDLSKKRAESVKTYLVSLGVDAGRIEAVGYSHTKLAMSAVIAQRVE